MLSVISKAITKLKPAGSAAAGDVKSGKTFYNTTTKEIRTGTFAAQTKSVTPSASAQTVTPDTGKYLSSVSVAAISSAVRTQTVTQNVTTNAGATNVAKTFTFSNLTRVLGVTSIRKTGYTTYNNQGIAGSVENTRTVMTISGNVVTIYFTTYADVQITNTWEVIAVGY